MMNFSEDYSVALEGSVLEGVATVKVPHMPFLESINATSIPAKLEVVVDGQFFVPWQDNLEIKKEVKVESVALEDQTTKEEKTSVSVNAIYEEADSEEEMEEASCPSDDEDKEESETEEEPEEEKKEETVEKKVEPKIEKKKHKDYSNLTLDQFLNSAVSAQEFFGD
jgi:hypothetical protein